MGFFESTHAKSILLLQGFFHYITKEHAELHLACVERATWKNYFQRFAELIDKTNSEQITACFTASTMHGEVTAPAAHRTGGATARHSW